MAAFRSSALWLIVVGPSLLACLYDGGDRCGPHQEYDGDRCVCAAGYGLTGNQCIACGTHEVGSLAGCSCEPGFVRASANGPCEEQAGLGKSCQSDSDCTHPGYSYCRVEGGTGYCTVSNCKDSSACNTSIDYACNDRATPTFCERPPTGLGTACSDSSACAGFEASYCEALSEKVCLVNGCKEKPDKCHGDWVCCDIGVLRESLCIPPSSLEGGKCPVGGTLIPRGQ